MTRTIRQRIESARQAVAHKAGVAPATVPESIVKLAMAVDREDAKRRVDAEIRRAASADDLGQTALDDLLAAETESPVTVDSGLIVTVQTENSYLVRALDDEARHWLETEGVDPALAFGGGYLVRADDMGALRDAALDAGHGVHWT